MEEIRFDFLEDTVPGSSEHLKQACTCVFLIRSSNDVKQQSLEIVTVLAVVVSSTGNGAGT